MTYRMIFNQMAYFGRGAIKEISGVASSHGFHKAFVVTDPPLVENGTVHRVLDVLDAAGIAYELFDQRQAEPAHDLHSGWRGTLQQIRLRLSHRTRGRLPAGYLQGDRHRGRQS